MNEQTKQALIQVINYMIEAEQDHYEETPKEERSNHIYLEVLKLNEWIETEEKGDDEK